MLFKNLKEYKWKCIKCDILLSVPVNSLRHRLHSHKVFKAKQIEDRKDKLFSIVPIVVSSKHYFFKNISIVRLRASLHSFKFSLNKILPWRKKTWLSNWSINCYLILYCTHFSFTSILVIISMHFPWYSLHRL